MRCSVKRDGRSGRFTSVKITSAGAVVTANPDQGKRGVSASTLKRASKAANTSLKTLEAK